MRQYPTSVPMDLPARLLRWCKSIDPADLLDGGEPAPSLDILDGLADSLDAQTVVDALASLPPPVVTLGQVRTYRYPGHDELAIPVHGRDLDHFLHVLAEQGVAGAGEADPRITLARLRPGAGQDYSGDGTFDGERLALGEPSLHAADGTVVKAWQQRGPDKSDPTGKRKVWYDDQTHETRRQVTQPGSGKRSQPAPSAPSSRGSPKPPPAPEQKPASKQGERKPPVAQRMPDTPGQKHPEAVPVREEKKPSKFQMRKDLHPGAAAALKDVARALQKADHLSSEQKLQYAEATQSALSGMTETALQSFRSNYKGVRFYETSLALTNDILASMRPERREYLVRGKASIGGAVRPDGTLALDGGRSGEAAESARRAGQSVEAREIYAHEFSHIIDGGKQYLHSGSDEWQEAFDSELTDGALTKYAGTKPAEGFAEFGRLVLMARDDTERAAIKEKFPLCYGYWESQGLAPAVKVPRRGVLRILDLFAGRMELEGGGHADMLRGESRRPSKVLGALSRLTSGARAGLRQLVGRKGQKAFRKAVSLVEVAADNHEDRLILLGWLTKKWVNKPGPRSKNRYERDSDPKRVRYFQQPPPGAVNAAGEPMTPAQKQAATVGDGEGKGDQKPQDRPARPARSRTPRTDPQEVQGKVQAMLQGKETVDVPAVADLLMGLTVKQAQEMTAALGIDLAGARSGLKASVVTKLAVKLAALAVQGKLGGGRPDKPEQEPEPAPAAPEPSEPSAPVPSPEPVPEPETPADVGGTVPQEEFAPDPAEPAAEPEQQQQPQPASEQPRDRRPGAWRERLRARQEALSRVPEERRHSLDVSDEEEEDKPARKRPESRSERVERLRRNVEQTGRALDE